MRTGPTLSELLIRLLLVRRQRRGQPPKRGCCVTDTCNGTTEACSCSVGGWSPAGIRSVEELVRFDVVACQRPAPARKLTLDPTGERFPESAAPWDFREGGRSRKAGRRPARDRTPDRLRRRSRSRSSPGEAPGVQPPIPARSPPPPQHPEPQPVHFLRTVRAEAPLDVQD